MLETEERLKKKRKRLFIKNALYTNTRCGEYTAHKIRETDKPICVLTYYLT